MLLRVFIFSPSCDRQTCLLWEGCLAPVSSWQVCLEAETVSVPEQGCKSLVQMKLWRGAEAGTDRFRFSALLTILSLVAFLLCCLSSNSLRTDVALWCACETLHVVGLGPQGNYCNKQENAIVVQRNQASWSFNPLVPLFPCNACLVFFFFFFLLPGNIGGGTLSRWVLCPNLCMLCCPAFSIWSGRWRAGREHLQFACSVHPYVPWAPICC